MGFTRDQIFFNCARETGGTHTGEPYQKPAHIQINTKTTLFWVEETGQTLQFTYDPTRNFTPVPLKDKKSFSELEGYFLALEKHLNIINDIRNQTVQKPPVAAKDLRSFIQTLLKQFEKEKQEAVYSATLASLDTPQAYIKDHQVQLAERGITNPVQDLHIIALVNALEEIGAVAELDWKADDQTAFWQIARLAQKQGVAIKPIKSTATMETSAFLSNFAKDLASQNHVLESIDISSDSYVLYIVPAHSFKKMKRLAKKIGIRTELI